MTPAELHDQVRRSLQEIVREPFVPGLRALLEDGSAEGVLGGLLFIVLSTDRSVSREWAIEGRGAADIVVHAPPDLFVELKQLHLKDGCRYAPGNLARDLRRHPPDASLGVLYVIDERASTSARRRPRFNDANRRVPAGPEALEGVLEGLRATFRCVTPGSVSAARVATFGGLAGLDVYAFVVQHPL